MASSLTYQFRQQQQEQQQMDNKQDGLSATNLPSPPDSSYGEDNTPFTSSAACVPPSSLPTHLPRHDMTDGNQAPQHPPDSLQSHFSTLTLQAITNSLPENYTIDHSSIKASLQQALVNTVAAATKTLPTPIPIDSSLQATSPAPPFSQLSSTMPATGGSTIRHPSTTNHRHYSESPNTQHNHHHHHHHHHHTNSSNAPTSTSLPSSSTGYHRCDDCGKVYKHPSCLMKHRWEHSEEWELTSKLLLTKHQQVQMLEAAAILVSMDKHPPSSLRRLVEEEDDDDDVDILNDDDDEGGDDDEVYVNIDDDDDDDDDILMDLDEEEPMDQAHTFPSMVGSTPAMLPSSFSTHVV